jgi:flagellar L-ring protein precursor FlgH
MKKFLAILFLLVLSSAPGRAQVATSLFTDVKAFAVGDIVSVIIVETANATRESRSNNSSSTDLNAGGSVSGNLTDFLPAFGASSSFNNSFDGQEGTEQSERLTGRISVRIAEKTDTGMLRIHGEREVGVNGENNLMELEGFIRPRDIMANNTVYSYNIADARITYKKSGLVNSVVAPGTLSTIFTSVLGVALFAVAAGLIVL